MKIREIFFGHRLSILFIIIFAVSCSQNLADDLFSKETNTPIADIPLFLNEDYLINNGWYFYSPGIIEGMSRGQFRKITMTGDGTMWFATSEGVSSFDGTNWFTYTAEDGLGSDFINDIEADPLGGVWVATQYGGLSYFNGEYWETFSKKTVGFQIDSVKVISVTKDNVLWGGTEEEVFRYDGSDWTVFSCDDGLACGRIQALSISIDDKVWVATFEGISVFDGTKWKTYPLDYGLNENRSSPLLPIRDMYAADDGSIWFISDIVGVTHIVGEERVDYSISGKIPLVITGTNNGILWVGTLDGFVLANFDGITWISIDGHDLKYFESNKREPYAELPFRGVLDIFEESEEVLWFATEIGVFRYQIQ